jgi:hypothetical protein
MAFLAVSASITLLLTVMRWHHGRAGEFPRAQQPWLFVSRDSDPIAFKSHQQIMTFCVTIFVALTLVLALNFFGFFL